MKRICVSIATTGGPPHRAWTYFVEVGGRITDGGFAYTAEEASMFVGAALLRILA